MSVNVTALSTGVPIAAETIGTESYQLVKLVDGGVGSSSPVIATSGVPAGGSVGLVVAVKPGVSVSAQVSGTVSVSGPVQVSGVVSVSVLPAISVSVSAVLGTLVTLLGTVAVAIVAGAGGGGSVATTTPASNATAQVVRLAGGQDVTAPPVYVSGAVSITGVSVGVVVSGPVSISAMPGVSIVNVVPVTTAASVSVTALPVWLNPTQQVVVSGLAGHSVSAVVSGTVSLSGPALVVTQAQSSGILVWLAPTQTLSVVIASTAVATTTQAAVTGAVVWLAPTQTVQLSGVVPVTTAVSVSVAGLPVWLNPTQQVVVSGLVGHSITGSVNIVSTAIVAGTVSVLNVVPVTTAASVSVTALPVWLNPTQQVVVSGFAGQSVSAVVSGTVSLSGPALVVTQAQSSGILVWLAPTQTLSVVIGTTALATTTQAAVTGAVVWLAPTQTVIVSGLAGHSITGSVNIVSTAVVTLATGGTIATILGTQLVSVAASAILGTVVAVSGVTAVSAVSTIVTILGTQIVTLATGGTIATLLGTVMVAPNFSTTAQPSTSATGAVVWIANPTTVTVTVTQANTGTVTVSGAILAVTTQSAASGAPVWLAPTQTITATVNLLATTITQAAVSGLPVWLAPTQTIAPIQISVSQALGTIITQLGTQIVTMATGGTIATLLGVVAVSGSGLLYTTGIPDVASTGQIVVPKNYALQPVVIMVTSTAIAQSAAMYLMTVWTNGTVAAAATTAWPVPAGKVFRASVLQAGVSSSAVVGGTIQVVLLAATATASMVSGSLRTQGFQLIGQGIVSVIPVPIGPMFADAADTPAGTTIGIALIASTACVLNNVIAQGYLF